ncbi:glycosyltransferase family 2 protein [Candidatus Solirubrobacter pratensis]|uniref:glycosyltransferase family 2 protein n=1 Tax=Candidatus Solirubrobacter pratensis TaxID=1298857 RepID=UPI000411851A|nr:glycosyltransferase [Candidatus Solirubrobacter pratensis]
MAEPRVAVVVPCFEAAELVLDAVRSIREWEPIELVVVDDASTETTALAQLERHGVNVIRRVHNGGPSAARNDGLAATAAPYVLPLDADDLLVPGALAAMADRLDGAPAAAACVGDYEEFGTASAIRAIPDTLDPYRVAFNNDYPITALYRRAALERAGGWRDPLPGTRGYEDWGLWMTLAERGERIVHLGGVAYRRRLHAPGVNAAAQRRHAALYAALRAGHPRLFAELAAHRRASTLPALRRLAYPVLLGDRRLLRGAHLVKPLLDRAGIGTRRA